MTAIPKLQPHPRMKAGESPYRHGQRSAVWLNRNRVALIAKNVLGEVEDIRRHFTQEQRAELVARFALLCGFCEMRDLGPVSNQRSARAAKRSRISRKRSVKAVKR